MAYGSRSAAFEGRLSFSESDITVLLKWVAVSWRVKVGRRDSITRTP